MKKKGVFKPKAVSVSTRHGTELIDPKPDPADISEYEMHRRRVIGLMRYDRARMAERLKTVRPAPLVWEDLPTVRPTGQPMATPREANPTPPVSAYECAVLADRIVAASLMGAAVALGVCAVWAVLK